jgi:hypothetical protein
MQYEHIFSRAEIIGLGVNESDSLIRGIKKGCPGSNS